MKVEKASLVAMLLEVGEANAAVLLARSELPHEIDTKHDLDALLTFGLERDQVDEVRKRAARQIVKCARSGRTTLGDLTAAGRRAFIELVPAPK